MGATPLRRAERPETRERHYAALREAAEGIGGLGVELRTLGPWTIPTSLYVLLLPIHMSTTFQCVLILVPKIAVVVQHGQNL